MMRNAHRRSLPARAGRVCPLVMIGILLSAAGCATRMDTIRNLSEVPLERVPKAERKLTKIATDPEQHTSRRCLAVQSLVRLRGAAAIPTLAKLSGSGGSSAIRRWAVWALGDVDSPAAIGPLNAAIRSTTDRETTCRALEALAKLAEDVHGSSERTLDTLRSVNVAQGRFPDCGPICRLIGLLYPTLMTPDSLMTLVGERVAAKETVNLFVLVNWMGQYVTECEGDPENEGAARAVELLGKLAGYEPCAPVRYRSLWFLGRFADDGRRQDLYEAAKRGPDRLTKLLALWALARTDRRMLESEFRAMPPAAFPVKPGNWREAVGAARGLGEDDLEIQRCICNLLREGGGL